MTSTTGEKQLFGLFADTLDYPSPDLASKVRECQGLLKECFPAAAELLQGLRSLAEAVPPERLEEVYTGFFDLNAVCHPYVGYQLFGESYKRSVFLLGLKEHYRAHHFEPEEKELPDRLSIVLRFLASSSDEDLNREITRHGLLPALGTMTKEGEAAVATAGPPDLQLEGHSHGEVLKGGFLLHLTEADDDHASKEPSAHPYKQALQALRLVLETLDMAQEGERTADASGETNHG